ARVGLAVSDPTLRSGAAHIVELRAIRIEQVPDQGAAGFEVGRAWGAPLGGSVRYGSLGHGAVGSAHIHDAANLTRSGRQGCDFDYTGADLSSPVAFWPTKAAGQCRTTAGEESRVPPI